MLSQKLLKGLFYKLNNNLRQYPENFFRYYRTSVCSFDELLFYFGLLITFEDTPWRPCIPQLSNLQSFLLEEEGKKNLFISNRIEKGA